MVGYGWSRIRSFRWLCTAGSPSKARTSQASGSGATSAGAGGAAAWVAAAPCRGAPASVTAASSAEVPPDPATGPGPPAGPVPLRAGEATGTWGNYRLLGRGHRAGCGGEEVRDGQD